MKAIPTVDAQGRRYRSRLEARWAAMFRLLGWSFEYEPHDLDGWIPDFVLFADDEILVEVKPFSTLGEYEHGALTKVVPAVTNSSKRGKEILLLGCAFPIPRPIMDWALCLGWLGEWLEAEGEYYFAESQLTHHHGRWGLAHTESSWLSRFDLTIPNCTCYGCTSHPNKLHVDSFGIEASTARSLWGDACNEVQWRGSP